VLEDFTIVPLLVDEVSPVETLLGKRTLLVVCFEVQLDGDAPRFA
jgi:hypothetical protein